MLPLTANVVDADYYFNIIADEVTLRDNLTLITIFTGDTAININKHNG